MLWQEVMAFDLDAPLSPYGFSTRLATENHWTQAFCEGAILEYKKFMLLAATAGEMVSPSPIVDVVWHQHLIFTESYQAFCGVLGKNIQHIPSTHSFEKEDAFRSAEKRTRILYEQQFGPQPAAFWAQRDIWDDLPVKPFFASWEMRISFSALAILGMVIVATLVFQPLYFCLPGMKFFGIWLPMIGLTLAALYVMNATIMQKTARNILQNSNLQQLRPGELRYLETGKIDDVIHLETSILLEEGILKLMPTGRLEKRGKRPATTPTGLVIVETANRFPRLNYPYLVPKIRRSPAFHSILQSLGALKHKIRNSGGMTWIMLANIGVLAVPFAFGMGRLVNGILHDKPFAFLLVGLALFSVGAIVWLKWLESHFWRGYLLKAFYKEAPVSAELKEGAGWEIMRGSLMGIATALLPFAYAVSPVRGWAWRNKLDGGGDGHSCGGGGSSCGGGGSCGGASCGGGGCGGCGA